MGSHIKVLILVGITLGCAACGKLWGGLLWASKGSSGIVYSEFLFVPASNRTHMYKVQIDGSLLEMNTTSPLLAGAPIMDKSAPMFAMNAKTSSFVLYGDWTSGSVSSVKVAYDGTLSSGGKVGVADFDNAAPIMDPTARFVYMAVQGQRDIFGYNVSPTGVLTAAPWVVHTHATDKCVSNGDIANQIAFDAAGKYMYVAIDTPANRIDAYNIDQVDGHLTPAATASYALTDIPSQIYTDPSGQILLEQENQTNHVVRAWLINPANGNLTNNNSAPFNFSGFNAPYFDATGKTFYVNENHAARTISLDPTTGNVASLGDITPVGVPANYATDPTSTYSVISDNGLFQLTRINYSTHDFNIASTINLAGFVALDCVFSRYTSALYCPNYNNPGYLYSFKYDFNAGTSNVVDITLVDSVGWTVRIYSISVAPP